MFPLAGSAHNLIPYNQSGTYRACDRDLSKVFWIIIKISSMALFFLLAQVGGKLTKKKKKVSNALCCYSNKKPASLLESIAKFRAQFSHAFPQSVLYVKRPEIHSHLCNAGKIPQPLYSWFPLHYKWRVEKVRAKLLSPQTGNFLR